MSHGYGRVSSRNCRRRVERKAARWGTTRRWMVNRFRYRPASPGLSSGTAPPRSGLPSAPTAPTWLLPAATGRPGCGMQLPASRSAPSPATNLGCGGLRSAPKARSWPPPAKTRWRCSGHEANLPMPLPHCHEPHLKKLWRRFLELNRLDFLGGWPVQGAETGRIWLWICAPVHMSLAPGQGQRRLSDETIYLSVLM
jgi:hypothetical protein